VVLQLRAATTGARRVADVGNIADFISAYIIGNLLQMGFRF
jgi:hypothetical protein